MKIKSILFAGLCAAQAHAAILVTYVPTGSAASSPSGAPVNGTSVAPSVTAGAITNVIPNATLPALLSSGGSGPVRTTNGSWTFGTDGWLCVNFQQDGANGTADSTGYYFGMTLDVTNPLGLNLTSLTFDYGLGQNNGVAAQTGNFYYGVFASVNGGAFSQIGSTFDSGSITLAQNVTTSLGNQNIDLSSITGAQNVALRVWVGSTSAVPSGGSIFRNITVNGTVVPEPSTALLGGLGMLVLLRRRRGA